MEKTLNIVLSGQANVGKSTLFNDLTGLHQHIGNWPGKTIEKAEGTLYYKGYTINVLDLPGIYSLATYSIEEVISREFIAIQKPDFVVNIVDGTNLERNLIFTLQILELERPAVLALNFVNLFEEKGIEIDCKKLEELLGIPVVQVAAIYGKGTAGILDKGIELFNRKTIPKSLKYGQEIEIEIEKITKALNDIDLPYPRRWLAIKLLEKDEGIEKLVQNRASHILKEVKKSIFLLEKIHGHSSAISIAAERCYLASEIVKKALKIKKSSKISFVEKLDLVTTHRIWGYPILALILSLMFGFIFKFGAWLSSAFEGFFSNIQIWYENIFGSNGVASLGWAGVESVLSLIAIALPYIVPFYIVLYLLEDWGYLARLAFLMDNLMHKLGIHGKACIPLLLGYGCNVPACLSCRIMETQRERFITGFLTTFVPCSAITVIILGLVGKFVGMGWAFGLYLFNILVIFGLGKLVSKVLPGEPTDLIMEMPDYRRPHLKTIFLQAWFRLKEFLFIAGPVVIISGVLIQGFYLANWLAPIADFLSPITVKWLGLPTAAGILLIFGILRKELVLLMLAVLFGTTDFASILNFEQMITLALVSMFYIPCAATIAALWREFGWKKTLEIATFKIIFAIALGGIALRILRFLMV